MKETLTGVKEVREDTCRAACESSSLNYTLSYSVHQRALLPMLNSELLVSR